MGRFCRARGLPPSGSEASQHRRIALARVSCTSVWLPRGRKELPANSFANSGGDSSGEFSPSNIRPDPSIAEHHPRNRGSAASDVQNLLAFTLWSNLELPQITLAMQQSYCNITPLGISRNPGIAITSMARRFLSTCGYPPHSVYLNMPLTLMDGVSIHHRHLPLSSLLPSSSLLLSPAHLLFSNGYLPKGNLGGRRRSPEPS